MNIAGLIRDVLSGRQFLPNCSECKSGKIHKKTETIDTVPHKGGFHNYGIVLPDIVTEKIKETTYCDRCSYENIREYETEGN